MSLIYGAFAIILTIAIFTNIIMKRPGSNRRSDAFTWSVVAIPYLLFFLVLIYYNTTKDVWIYVFQTLSAAGYVWQFRQLEFKNRIAPVQVPLGLIAFVVAWTAMGAYLGMDKVNVLIPSILVLVGVSLMMATYFFMRTDREVQLKSVIAVLYAMMCFIKVLYIFNGINEEPIFFIGVFVLDFMIYAMISVLVYLNSHYSRLIVQSKRGMQINGLLEDAPEPIALLSSMGDIIYMNEVMKETLARTASSIHGIADLFKVFGPDESQDWLQAAVDGFEKGDGCLFPIGEETEDGHQKYFSLDVFPTGETYNIFFRIRTYPARGFWVGNGRRSIDSLTVRKPDRELESIFSFLAENCELDKKFGLLLLRINNAESIENQIGKELYRDFLGTFSKGIAKSKGVNSISMYNVNTFLIMTDTGSFRDVQERADHVVQQIAAPYKISKASIHVQPEIGVSVYPDNGGSYSELVRTAQIALARNTVGNNDHLQYYDPGYKYLQSDRDDLENHLKNAVHNGELTMLFQPQVSVFDESFRGFEALIRWDLADGKSVSPNIFIPMAEDLGLIEEIGLWALEEALARTAEWHEDFGCDFTISVNISSHQLEKETVVKQVSDLLTKYEVPPKYLELEVTESKILRTSKEVYKSLNAFKKLGIQIALDDFGTGYSSLDYLRWLPFDVLKIDKSFIDNLGEDTVESEIVHSVISLVNKMNLETVAEGVETQEQLKILRQSGCTYIQGYLYSKPLTAFEARETLLKID